jgi:hypothetical protein
MRLAPIRLAFRQNIALAIRNAGASSRLTHAALGVRSKSAYSSGTRIVENSSQDAKRDPIPIKRARHTKHGDSRTSRFACPCHRRSSDAVEFGAEAKVRRIRSLMRRR